MKKLMMLLLLCLAMVPAWAQQDKSNILVYKTDGSVDTLLLNNVRDLVHSRIDTAGVEQADLSTLRITMVDGQRVYALADIDHLVMPKFGRVISFMGTNDTPDSLLRRTSVNGNTFPGNQGDVVNYKWSQYDRLYLASGMASETLPSDRANAVFSFRSDSLIADKYVVYYPGQRAKAFNKVTIPTVQKQNKANDSNHLSTSGDCGTAVATRSEAASAKDKPEYTFHLDHKTAVICFLPHVDSLRTIVLKSIGVKADKTIAGDYTLTPDGILLTEGTGRDSILLKTSSFPIPEVKGTPEAQDSVASYMVVAPQTDKTNLTVYYRVYDTWSGIDTTVIKQIYYDGIKPAMVYTATNNIPISYLLYAMTDSVQWDFSKPATLYGTVNIPVEKVGFIWGPNSLLNEETKENSVEMDYATHPFSHQAINSVDMRAYYYRAYAKSGDRTVYGKVKKFGLAREPIDLGLSVRWSTINLGGITPEDGGDYFAWAETATKSSFSQNNYKYYKSGKYITLPKEISGDPRYDAATAIWGGCWRMPTRGEWKELTNLSWNRTTLEDKDVYKIKGKNDSIFLSREPYAWGRFGYWTASNADGYYANDKSSGYRGFNDGTGTESKWLGLPIRPVYDSNITTKKGQGLFIRTDSVVYGDDNTSLFGTMRGLDQFVTPITEGFVIGSDSTVTLESTNTKILNKEVEATQNGTYSLALDEKDLMKFTNATNYYFRAYLTFDGVTYYGKPLTMDAITIHTDSTNWQVNKTSAILYGRATGITPDMKNAKIGFVVGTQDDITIGASGVLNLVCDSTVNGRFACAYTNIPDKQLFYRAYLDRGDGTIIYGKVKLFGLEMVDLGLPTKTLWANISVGAQTPMDNGNYYRWGTILPSNKSYLQESVADICGSANDAAQMNWQSVWKLPSSDEFNELLQYCDYAKTTYYGCKGILFTSKQNGKSIFMPYTTSYYSDTERLGYWSGTSVDNNKAYSLYSKNDGGKFSVYVEKDYRSWSRTIRPVARYNMSTTAGDKMQLTTDSVHWSVGSTKATLYGYLLGMRFIDNASESGFIYGTTPGLQAEQNGANKLLVNDGITSDVRIANGMFSCIMPNVDANTTYYYKAYVKVGNTYYYGEEREFGSQWVDLGLKSKTLWSTVNIGAGSAEYAGKRFAWGETAPRTSFTKDEYLAAAAKGDIAGSNYDAAHKIWGALATMPTRADIEELLGCTWEEVTRYGQPMYKVTGPNKNCIYLLKNLNFWSSTMNGNISPDNSEAYMLSGTHTLTSQARYSGQYIRPVMHVNAELADNVKAFVSTDSCNWQVGRHEVRLRGTVATTTAVDGLTRGFLLGTSATLMAGGKDVQELTATASDTDNSITATATYAKDTTYYYRAFIKQGDKYYYGEVRRYGLQLVDMGNGLKWASINIGSQYDADRGNRFAWGETTTKSSYTLSTYKYYDSDYQPLRVDISGTAYDAAHTLWGGDWRMPTALEMRILVDSCTWTAATVDGQPGFTVTAKNGNSIFLPSAGYQEGTLYTDLDSEANYWTATHSIESEAYRLHATATDKQPAQALERFYGLSIRPVLPAGAEAGKGGDITGGHKKGGSTDTGGNGSGSNGSGGGNAGTGNTGGTLGN